MKSNHLFATLITTALMSSTLNVLAQATSTSVTADKFCSLGTPARCYFSRLTERGQVLLDVSQSKTDLVDQAHLANDLIQSQSLELNQDGAVKVVSTSDLRKVGSGLMMGASLRKTLTENFKSMKFSQIAVKENFFSIQKIEFIVTMQLETLQNEMVSLQIEGFLDANGPASSEEFSMSKIAKLAHLTHFNGNTLKDSKELSQMIQLQKILSGSLQAELSQEQVVKFLTEQVIPFVVTDVAVVPMLNSFSQFFKR